MKKFRPGVSFGDFIVPEMAKTRRVVEAGQVPMPRLSTWLWVGSVIAMGAIVARLVMLQVISGGKYRVLADENRMLRIILPARRGGIWDRNGEELAGNWKTVKMNEQLRLETEEWERQYPAGAASAHVVGYLGRTGEGEVGLVTEAGKKYGAESWIGRMGIEEQYEEVLRGKDGGRLVELDSNGRVVRELGRQAPVDGAGVKLSLDLCLQRAATEALGGRKGAVVASVPKTGEILVLASSPTFDPNKISAQYPGLGSRKDLPFFNRAVSGVFVPGSVFKMAAAAAAMAQRKVGGDFTYQDTGAISVGRFSYTNWYFTQYGRTEGLVGWVRAIARSTDTFFYKIGEMTGAEAMADWGNRLGLGQAAGIDLPGEAEGLMPTPEWKQRTKGEAWFLGNTYHMAIGQGDILVTPLQVNVMTNVLATGGEKCKPHLRIQDLRVKVQECPKVEIDRKILEIIKEGMIGACSTGGTAFPFFDFEPRIACKTGTAEYVDEDGKGGTHAWFTAYAPADDPTISVTVLLEGGGEGSRAAAPAARKILARYFGIEDKYNYSAVRGEGE